MTSWDINKPLNLQYNRKNAITNSEKAFIFANYKTMSGNEMARRLGRSAVMVQKFMHKYNLPFKGK